MEAREIPSRGGDPTGSLARKFKAVNILPAGFVVQIGPNGQPENGARQ